ncbi:MAG: dynamin family protein [Streptococcus salivarius]
MLREIRFLYVLGTYSAGKSTFINALIGQELLPSAETQ